MTPDLLKHRLGILVERAADAGIPAEEVACALRCAEARVWACVIEHTRAGIGLVAARITSHLDQIARRMDDMARDLGHDPMPGMVPLDESEGDQDGGEDGLTEHAEV